MATVKNARDVLLQAAASRYSNPPNAAILLVASSPVFHIAAGGAHDPASITFTASLIELAGPVTFVATGGTLTVVGNVATLTYANMPGATATVKASLTENGQSYESNICNITKVSDGTNGTVGLNNARVYAYQRAATAPTLSPGDVTVTFASNSITSPPALLNGWVRDIPSTNGNPLYVVAISGAGTGSTVNLLASSWSGATVLATDGPGGTGTNGTNGLNAATVMIFQRTATATAPAKPTIDTTYTFPSGVLAGLNNGWLQGVPVNDPAKQFLHTTLATAISASATDTIPATEWATVQLLYDAAAVIAAQAAADNAVNQAALANAEIAVIADDNKISKGEKPAEILRYNAAYDEHNDLYQQATSIGAISERNTYYDALVAVVGHISSIANFSNPTVESAIVGVTYRAVFLDYYTKKQALLNAIAAKIKVDAAADATAKANAAAVLAVNAAAIAAQAKADLAETTAKAYADGIVTAEEQRAINDATTKAEAARVAAVNAAAADATAKANLAATTATWGGVSGADKPQDNATVGAPAGTLVGNTDAQTVANNAAAGIAAANKLNNPPLLGNVSNIITNYSTGGPAKTVSTINASATGGSGPYKFSYSYSASQSNDEVEITFTKSSSGGNTDNICVVKALSFTQGLVDKGELTVTVHASGLSASYTAVVQITSVN